MSRITLLFLSCHLLLGHSHSTRTFSGARICMSALPSDRKSSPMTQATVAADVHQAFDVHLYLLAQIAFDAALLIDDRSNAVNFLFRQLANALINADPGLSQDLIRARATNTVDVCKTDLSSLICR